jgi:hypothetical protein
MEIITEDKVVVQEGDTVYDFYNRKWGTIRVGSAQTDSVSGTWFDVDHVGGGKSFLNGERICSVAYAKSRGW